MHAVRATRPGVVMRSRDIQRVGSVCPQPSDRRRSLGADVSVIPEKSTTIQFMQIIRCLCQSLTFFKKSARKNGSLRPLAADTTTGMPSMRDRPHRSRATALGCRVAAARGDIAARLSKGASVEVGGPKPGAHNRRRKCFDVRVLVILSVCLKLRLCVCVCVYAWCSAWYPRSWLVHLSL